MSSMIERRLAKLEAAHGRADDPSNYPARRYVMPADWNGDRESFLKSQGCDFKQPGWIIVRQIVRPAERGA